MSENLLMGLSLVLEPINLLLIAAGAFGGIMVGAIPGLTATMAVALLVPVTFGMEMVPAISMLLGVYAGAISGGFVSAALLKIPGTPSSVATTFDAYPMILKGEHEKALGLALLSSFIGGTVSGIVLLAVAPSLAKVALKFGPFEYFALVIFTFSCVSSFSSGSTAKAFFSACVGMTLSMVGTCPVMQVSRFTFGCDQLSGGFAILPALIGMFALPQILEDVRPGGEIKANLKQYRVKARNLAKAIKYFRHSIVNLTRTIIIGIGVGILPGVGPGLSNILAYSQAKSNSKTPEKFGTGMVDGVIASEAANNASMGGALMPLLTLGIPGDGVTLMMMGAFMLHGIQPGPLMFQNNPDVVYSIFIAFLVACVFVALFQLFFMNLYVRILSVKKQYLGPVLLVMCVVGCYACNNRMFDVWTFLGFGLLGCLFNTLNIPNLPLILGLILGPMAEAHIRTGLDLSDGSYLPLVTTPIPAFFMALAVFSLLFPIIKDHRRKSREGQKPAEPSFSQAER